MAQKEKIRLGGILGGSDNPVLEITKPSGEDIYVQLESGTRFGDIVIFPRFVELINYNLDTGSCSERRLIEITEEDIANANLVTRR